MNFDEIWWKHGFHQLASKFIKKTRFWKKSELWWNLMKTRFSSKFIKVHQNSSKLNSFEKCNNQWLKPDLDLQHLEKVEINVTNVCWTLVLVQNLYVLNIVFIWLVTPICFGLEHIEKHVFCLNKKCVIYDCFILFWFVLMYCFGLVEKSRVFFHMQNN